MDLAETLVPLLPLTPTGFITLKADLPRRFWNLDETYHAPLVWKLEIVWQRYGQNVYPTSEAVGEQRTI